MKRCSSPTLSVPCDSKRFTLSNGFPFSFYFVVLNVIVISLFFLDWTSGLVKTITFVRGLYLLGVVCSLDLVRFSSRAVYFSAACLQVQDRIRSGGSCSIDIQSEQPLGPSSFVLVGSGLFWDYLAQLSACLAAYSNREMGNSHEVGRTFAATLNDACNNFHHRMAYYVH